MKILLNSIFSIEQLDHLNDFDADFKQLIAKLKRLAIIAVDWPVSFKINDVSYSFPDQETLARSIEELCAEFESSMCLTTP